MSHDYHHEKFVNLTCKHVCYYLYACKLSYQWQQSSIIDGLSLLISVKFMDMCLEKILFVD